MFNRAEVCLPALSSTLGDSGRGRCRKTDAKNVPKADAPNSYASSKDSDGGLAKFLEKRTETDEVRPASPDLHFI